MRLQFHPDLENCSRCWNFMKVLDWIHQGLWLVVVSLQSVPGMMISTFSLFSQLPFTELNMQFSLIFWGICVESMATQTMYGLPAAFQVRWNSSLLPNSRGGSSASANSSALAERNQSSVQAAGQGGGAWNWDELNDVGVSRWWNPFSMCKWNSSWKLFMLRWIGSEGQFTDSRFFRHGSAACVAWSCFVAGICWVDGVFFSNILGWGNSTNQTRNFGYVKWVKNVKTMWVIH